MSRVLDVVAAAFGLIILSPMLALVALAIKLSDFGPIFFAHGRVGQDGAPFRMLKFRSMRVNADKIGPAITVGGDARITPVGQFLRKTKLDEFPQLWNVLKGEMSLVGPRPEVDGYVVKYAVGDRAVLKLKPGITDPASFAFYDESDVLARATDPERFYVETLMPAKIRVNLAYAQRRTLVTDVFLIVATVLKPFGVHVDVFRHLGLTNPREGLT